MDPQSNQNQGQSQGQNQNASVPQPLTDGAATMPLPQQNPASVGVSTPQLTPQFMAQAPPMPQMTQPTFISQTSQIPQSSVLTDDRPVLAPTVPVHAIDVPNSASRVDPVNTVVPASPPEAADTDVIEKEWVTKAKQVVEQTRQDPFKQVREMNQLRADYMKKRYDKDLKISDA